MTQKYIIKDMNEKLLVIIPTYDEKDNVKPISEAVLTEAPEVNILFVDDQSPDGTGQILDQMAAADPRVLVMHREKKEGLGRAYIAGFKWALEREYELVCEMDADFSHDPKSLPELLKAAHDGADLVLGSRYIGGIRVMNWPMSRLLLSTGAGQYVRFVTGMPVCDPTGGFKCFHRKVLESIELDKITSNGYSFQIEMNHKAWMQGYKIKEVPIVFEDRIAGYSKMNSDIAFEAFALVLKLWFRCGCRRKPPVESKA
jgi:dolichol-phosphate mannosyltransferase